MKIDNEGAMMVGDVLRLRSVTHYNPVKKGEPGLLSVSYTAPKGTVFIAVLLGVEPKDGSQTLDLDATMNRLGWFRQDANGKVIDPSRPKKDVTRKRQNRPSGA